MFNRILVPLDGSTLAERAIPHAEQFARIFGSSIILLQVLDPTSYHVNHNPVDPLSWQIRKTEADMYMKAIAARVRENLGEGMADPKSSLAANVESESKKMSRVEYFIREGKTAENIVNFAHAENIDLLVIGTHGSGGLSRWNISSITQKVINLIYLSVLIVRAYNFSEIENARIRYRRILLPIDSSRRAESALSAGLALARGEKPADFKSEAGGLPPQQTTPGITLPQTKLILAAVIKPPELPIPEPYPAEIEQLTSQLNLCQPSGGEQLPEQNERAFSCRMRDLRGREHQRSFCNSRAFHPGRH